MAAGGHLSRIYTGGETAQSTRAPTHTHPRTKPGAALGWHQCHFLVCDGTRCARRRHRGNRGRGPRLSDVFLMVPTGPGNASGVPALGRSGASHGAAVTRPCLDAAAGGRRRPQPGGKGVRLARITIRTGGREGRRSGDEICAWEWGGKELSDEAEERPKRRARGWQRNMGPETENVRLREQGGQKGPCLPGNCPDSCLVGGGGRLLSCWEAAAFPAKWSSPRWSPSSWVRLPRPAQGPVAPPPCSVLPGLWPVFAVIGLCSVPPWPVVQLEQQVKCSASHGCKSPFVPGASGCAAPAPEPLLAVGSNGGVAFGFAFPCSPPRPPFPKGSPGFSVSTGSSSPYVNDMSPESHLAAIFSPLCHLSLDFVVWGLHLVRQAILVFMSSDFAGFS
nr:uncharacterized protein LOC102149235 isoform X1 [Equus caballus]